MKREDSELYKSGYTVGWWDLLTRDERREFLDRRTPLEREEFYHDWRIWARDDQLGPDWDWDTWLLLTGRGWGKTRTAVEWLLDKINTTNFPLRIAIVGQGEDDVRTVMVNGVSGFIACAPSWNKPTFRPSVGGGILLWPNGCQAFIYSIADTEALRGPAFHYGWCDEPMAAPRVQRERALDNLEFCLREGEHPQLILTTTPKPDPWLRSMEKDAKNGEESRIAITRGSTHDNERNLAANFLRKIERRYGGTKKGRQEIQGKILSDEEGALWTEDMLDKSRMEEVDPHELALTMDKIVVGVDPNTKGQTVAARTKKVAHAAGIVVVGARGKERFVLADRTTSGGPAKWSRAAVDAAEEFDADEIEIETNQGGDMVKLLLQQIMEDQDYRIHIHGTFSKKDKAGRAEPVSTVYERGDVHHVGPKAKLEDLEMQMLYLHEGEDPTGEDFDRCDALVGALTRLGLKKRASSARGGTGAGITTMGDFGRAPTHQGSLPGYPAEGGDTEL